MAHFLQDRSCNDDFVPLIRITRSTCEPNRLEQASYVPNDNTTNYNPYPDANIYFKERKNILSWEADPRLEAIDARLEEICARLEKKWNDDEILDTDDTHDTTRNDTTTRHDFYDERIRVEDFGLHYYHYQTLANITETKKARRNQVNIFAKPTMSCDEEIDKPE